MAIGLEHRHVEGGIIYPAIVIGVITFGLSMVGLLLGGKLG